MLPIRIIGLTAICAAALAGEADAAVVQYSYQGAPLFCDGDPGSTACGGPASAPGFFGQITFDTGLFAASGPATLRIAAASSRGDSASLYSYVATSFDGSRIDGDNLANATDIPFLVSFSGTIGRFLRPGDIGPNSLGLSFDRGGKIVGWYGSDNDGGSTDQYISTEGDSIGGFGSTAACTPGNVCTRVPGAWMRTVIDAGPAEPPAPAPVPLPAGGVLLAAALAALGVGRRIRRA